MRALTKTRLHISLHSPTHSPITWKERYLSSIFLILMLWHAQNSSASHLPLIQVLIINNECILNRGYLSCYLAHPEIFKCIICLGFQQYPGLSLDTNSLSPRVTSYYNFNYLQVKNNGICQVKASWAVSFIPSECWCKMIGLYFLPLKCYYYFNKAFGKSWHEQEKSWNHLDELLEFIVGRLGLNPSSTPCYFCVTKSKPWDLCASFSHLKCGAGNSTNLAGLSWGLKELLLQKEHIENPHEVSVFCTLWLLSSIVEADKGSIQ
jgi:hypothetical protein